MKDRFTILSDSLVILHHHQANIFISPKLKLSFSNDSYSEKPGIFLKLMDMYGAPIRR